MAGFRTHITTSTVLGFAYGGTAHVGYGVPLDQCLLAAGLCSVSGMLPDLDSDNGVPLRESLAFGAAVVPMLLIDRFRELGMSTDAMVLCGALIYVFIRFGLGKMLRQYTRHRGMFHSVPAAIIFGQVAYLLCDCSDPSIRMFKTCAVILGVLSHLILDELWSIEMHFGWIRFKRSFGTAFKLWDKVMWANISAYGKLALLTMLIMNEDALMGRHGGHGYRPNIVNQQPSPPKPRPSTAREPLRLFK